MDWICHVCSRRRPDAKISVATATFDVGGVNVIVTQRYCNDRRTCAEGAVKQAFDLAERGRDSMSEETP